MTLKEWRKSKGMSQQALAASVGVFQPTISRIERREDEASIPLALKVLSRTGLKIGPIKNLSREEIELLSRMNARAA